MVLRTPRDAGAFLRDRRKQLKLDQASVAAKVGVSRQWLIDIEQGKPRAELGLVLKTFAALGVHLTTVEATTSPEVEEIDAIVSRAADPAQARPRIPGRRPGDATKRRRVKTKR